MTPPSSTSTSSRRAYTSRDTFRGRATSHTTAPGFRSSGSTNTVVALVTVSTMSASRTASRTRSVASTEQADSARIWSASCSRRSRPRATRVSCSTWRASSRAQAAPMAPVAPTTAARARDGTMSSRCAAIRAPSTAVAAVYELPVVTGMGDRAATVTPRSPTILVNAPSPRMRAPSR